MTSAVTHTNSKNTSIVFERKVTLPEFSFLHKYCVLIDGVEIGVIGKGRTEFAIAPGKHVLELKMRNPLTGKVPSGGAWCSKEVDFTVSEGEQVAFFVRSWIRSGWFGWKLWTGVAQMQMLYCSIIDPSRWIIVERR